jgi:hypothetical protein
MYGKTAILPWVHKAVHNDKNDGLYTGLPPLIQAGISIVWMLQCQNPQNS